MLCTQKHKLTGTCVKACSLVIIVYYPSSIRECIDYLMLSFNLILPEYRFSRSLLFDFSVINVLVLSNAHYELASATILMLYINIWIKVLYVYIFPVYGV